MRFGFAGKTGFVMRQRAGRVSTHCFHPHRYGGASSPATLRILPKPQPPHPNPPPASGREAKFQAASGVLQGFQAACLPLTAPRPVPPCAAIFPPRVSPASRRRPARTSARAPPPHSVCPAPPPSGITWRRRPCPAAGRPRPLRILTPASVRRRRVPALRLWQTIWPPALRRV